MVRVCVCFRLRALMSGLLMCHGIYMRKLSVANRSARTHFPARSHTYKFVDVVDSKLAAFHLTQNTPEANTDRHTDTNIRFDH